MTKILLCFVLLAGLSALIFRYSLSTFWWHLRHGNGITYAHRSIVVPPKWVGEIGTNVIFLYKRPPTVFSGSNVLAMVTLAPNSNPPKTQIEEEELYKSFASIYWTNLARDGTAVQGPIRLGQGEKQVTCMQSTPISRTDLTDVTCLIFRGSWRATFVGRTQELDEFYRITAANSR